MTPQRRSARSVRTWHQLSDVYAGQRQASQGQVAIIFAILLLALVGFVALSIDGGYVMAERRQAQNAADAGALAAAKSLFDEKTGDIQTSGTSYATQNAGADSSSVVSWPPATGAHAGDDKYVQVSVTKNVRKFFVGAVYGGAWTVAASATAGIETEPADYALITLDKDDDPGVGIAGNAGIILRNGKASAMSNTTIDGNGTTMFQAPGTIDANGSIVQGGGGWTETREGVPQIDDPIVESGTVPPPRPTDTPPVPDCRRDCDLVEGLYRNTTIRISRTTTLTGGIYWFDNVILDFNSSASRIEGDNVLIYLTNGSEFRCGNCDVDLRYLDPMYNGGAPGMVFWSESCEEIDIGGNGTVSVEGIFYAPCSHVRLHGNPSSDTINGQIFVGTLQVNGTADMRVAYHKYAETDKPKIFLVE